MSGQPYPSSVYTYRCTLVSDEDLNALTVQFKAFAESTALSGKLVVSDTFKEVVGLGRPGTVTPLLPLGLQEARVPAGSLTIVPSREADGGGEVPDNFTPPAAVVGAAKMGAYYGTKSLVDAVEQADASLAGSQTEASIAQDAVSALLAWNQANREMASAAYWTCSRRVEG